MELNVKRIISEILKSNVYIISNKNEAVIVDAGASPEKIKQELQDLTVKAIFITHCHFDHVFYLESYIKEFNCPVYMSGRCPEGLENPKYNHGETLSIKPNDNFRLLKDNQIVKLLGTDILCIRTPGHSFSSMCYLFDNNILFSGDTVFAKAIGRYDLEDSDEEELIKSLKKLLNLNYDICHCGHSVFCDKAQMDENIKSFLKKSLL